MDSFIYILDTLVNQLLQTVIGYCGYFFSSVDPTWTYDSFKNNCWYSFVQGEGEDDVTDSGYIFPRELRDEADKMMYKGTGAQYTTLKRVKTIFGLNAN